MGEEGSDEEEEDGEDLAELLDEADAPIEELLANSSADQVRRLLSNKKLDLKGMLMKHLANMDDDEEDSEEEDDEDDEEEGSTDDETGHSEESQSVILEAPFSVVHSCLRPSSYRRYRSHLRKTVAKRRRRKAISSTLTLSSHNVQRRKSSLIT